MPPSNSGQIAAQKIISQILAKFNAYIQSHKGGVALKSLKNNLAILEISGACVNCALADLSYNKILRGLIKEKLPAVKVIFRKKVRTNSN